MPLNAQIFVTDERRAWMRMASHTVVFDRDPDFERYRNDPSGSVIRILHLWLADSSHGAPFIRHYLGCVRRCDCGGWMSRPELARLFRRATSVAQQVGERGDQFRARLSMFLRQYFSLLKNSA